MSVSFSTIIQKARPNPIAATTHAMREALAKVPPSHMTKLSNGLTVATEHNHTAQFATVGIWVNGGSRFDKRHINGTSKVLQYCGFQGTNTADRTALTRQVDELGGQLTVESGRDLSFVSVKVQKENVQKAVAFLADVYQNARLSDADIEAAKAAVEKARHQSEELPDHLVHDNLHVAAYDSTIEGGLGNHLYGSQAGIKAIAKADLEAFRKSQYTAPNTYLVGAGAVSQQELESLGQQFLGQLPSGGITVPEEPRYVGGDIRLWNLRNDLFHGAWAIETSGAMSADQTVFQLLRHVHGDFHRSQHELGQHAIHRLVKMYSSIDYGTPSNTHQHQKSMETMTQFYHQYEDTGLFGEYVVGRQSKTAHHLARSMSEAFTHSMSDFARMAQKCVDTNELEQAKVNMKAQLMFNMDGSHNTAKDLAFQCHKYGRRVSLEEMYARIDDVTGTNVQEVLTHYFAGRKPVISLYGYFYPMENYDLLQLMFHKFFY